MIDKLQAHYGFTRMPFGRDLAPGMLHRHAAHNEACARITWCIAERAIGVVTGEVGAGKTASVEHPGFGGDSILPRCSGLGGRCLPRYRRMAEPRSDHFPLLFYRTSVQLRCPDARPVAGSARQAARRGARASPRRAPRCAPRVPRAGQG